jgi:hypothetical protein
MSRLIISHVPALIQFVSRLKNGSLFEALLTRSRIFGLRPVAIRFFEEKFTELTGPDTVTICQSTGHSIEKGVNNGGSLRFGQVGGVFPFLNKIELVHAFGAPVILPAWGKRAGINR